MINLQPYSGDQLEVQPPQEQVLQLRESSLDEQVHCPIWSCSRGRIKNGVFYLC